MVCSAIAEMHTTGSPSEALAAQTITLPGEDTWGQIICGLVADLEGVHTARTDLAKQIEAVASSILSDKSW